jgi:predicted secreted protein
MVDLWRARGDDRAMLSKPTPPFLRDLGVVVAGCLLLAACGDGGPAQRARPVFADAEETIRMELGGEFEIGLDYNPTVSPEWRWRLAQAPDARVLALIGEEYVGGTNPGKRTGAGGTKHWIFRAAGAGEATAAFERGGEEKERLRFTIVVK